MFINKIGQQHLEYGLNCQDTGLLKDKIKIVCDGCSEGKNSEVGAKLFCHFYDVFNFSKYGKEGINYTFTILAPMFNQSSETIKNYICFTILIVEETDDEFIVYYCGDGFIILQDKDGNVNITELNDGEYPKYYAYNYTDKDSLKYYKDGVSIQEIHYPKSEYLNVGIASDGLRYIFTDKNVEEKVLDFLKNKKEMALKRLINKHQYIFKDDITIAF